jgi:RHS repeat-associated protein
MDYFNGITIVDTGGTVQERYGYSAFGVRRVMAPDFSARSSSDFDWEFGFHGQFLDKETGYCNYGYRYYVPWLGRWINRDPIGEQGGVNVYGFVGNSGLNGIDLFGLCWTDAQAVARYLYGSGSNVTSLTATGCESIVSSNIEFERKHWETVAKGEAMLKASTMAPGQTEVIADSDTVGANSGVFWIGGFSLYRTYSCPITVDSSDCYNYTCILYYNMSDVFEDPFDFDNSKGDPFGGNFWDDWEVGIPFTVYHQWGPDTVSGGGRR